jgi:hypothetical protein
VPKWALDRWFAAQAGAMNWECLQRMASSLQKFKGNGLREACNLPDHTCNVRTGRASRLQLAGLKLQWDGVSGTSSDNLLGMYVYINGSNEGSDQSIVGCSFNILYIFMGM